MLTRCVGAAQLEVDTSLLGAQVVQVSRQPFICTRFGSRAARSMCGSSSPVRDKGVFFVCRKDVFIKSLVSSDQASRETS
jgi:hypothetical protein